MGIITPLTSANVGALRTRPYPSARPTRLDSQLTDINLLSFGARGDGEDNAVPGGSFSGTNNLAAFKSLVAFLEEHDGGIHHRVRLPRGIYRVGDPTNTDPANPLSYIHMEFLTQFILIGDDPSNTIILMDEDYDYRIANNRGGSFFMVAGGLEAPFDRRTKETWSIQGVSFRGRWTHYPGGDGDDPNHVGPTPLRANGFKRVYIANCGFFDVRNKGTRCEHNDSFHMRDCYGERLARGFVRSVDTNDVVCTGNTVKWADDDVIDFNITSDIALQPPMSVVVSNNTFVDCESALCSQGRGVKISNNVFIRSKGAALGIVRAGGNQPTSGKVAHWGNIVDGNVIADNLHRYDFGAGGIEEDEEDEEGLGDDLSSRGCISMVGNRPSAATNVSANLTGTISVNASGTTITGVGTLFTTELFVGQVIRTAGGQVRIIRSITNNLSAQAMAAFETAESGVTFKRGIIPGTYDPINGEFVLPWDTDANTDNAGYMHGKNTGNYSIPAGLGFLVANNQIIRTLPVVAAYSDWGFGEMFTRQGWKDPPVTESAWRPNGIQLAFDMENALVIGNIVQHLSAAGIVIDGKNSDRPEKAFQNIKIAQNVIRRCENGVRVIGALDPALSPITSHWSIDIDGNQFDLDPYHELVNRFRSGSPNFPDGTWDATGVATRTGTAVWTFQVKGIKVQNNTFQNCYKPVGDGVNASPDGVEMLNNVLRCDPFSVGHHASNRGIGDCPRASDAFRYMIVNSNPQDGTSYLNLLNICTRQATAIPSSGKYVAGHEVVIDPPVASSSGMLLVRARRITTGSSHTVGGVDWREIYDVAAGALLTGSVQTTGVLSGSAAIADDTALVIPFPLRPSNGNQATSMVIEIAPGASAPGASNVIVQLYVRASDTQVPFQIYANDATNIAYANGVLAGTTGADTKWTYSATAAGNFYIENRTGASRNVAYTIRSFR
jgi:hypothetical protein